MENKQVDKKTHKTYNKNISLEMLSSLGAILVDIIELMLFKIKSYCTIVPLPILYYNNRCLSTKF